MFSRDEWTESSAKTWLKEHNYKTGKVDITENYYRFRQMPVKSDKIYRTITFGDESNGIKAVIQIDQ
jgi:hypothetical protein